MEQLLNQLTAEPLYLLVAGCLLIAVIFSVVKKVIKLLLYALIGLAAFLAYVAYTGSSGIEEADAPAQELLNNR